MHLDLANNVSIPIRWAGKIEIMQSQRGLAILLTILALMPAIVFGAIWLFGLAMLRIYGGT